MNSSRTAIVAALALAACAPRAPEEHYGFVTRLGNDTVAVESVTRRGNTLTSDAVDRFPRVRRRHTEVTLNADGSISHLVSDIHSPSEPASHRERHVVVDVTRDSVHETKKDDSATVRREFAMRPGEIAMAHVPQMYSLYELYFAAALKRAAAEHRKPGDTVQLRQFYVDREFDRFPLHRGVVTPLGNGRAEIEHDWLSGTGEATLDSAFHLLRYSGARTTYLVDVQRLTNPPDVQSVAARFEAEEARRGARQLSVRDTVRARVGAATFTVDYGRPLARGRVLLGGVIPYGFVWRTGANAATQFATSAPIAIAGLSVPAGMYTLWTIPHENGGVDLVVNKQTGQWGTGYGPANDLGRVPMKSDTNATPVEQFTISIDSTDSRHGTLAMAWGPFRWTAPIELR